VDGVAILYVSHRLDEVLRLCNRITVLRDGQIAGQAARGSLDKRGLIRAIIGHDARASGVRRRIGVDRTGTPIFSARNVSRGNAVKGVSFDLHNGEVLALGGLVGSGRTEVARLALGVDRLDGGHFELNGRPVVIANEAQAVRMGLALVPEERRSQGLMLQRSVSFNINLASLKTLRWVPGLPFLAEAKASRSARRHAAELGIKAASIHSKIAGLSGGNQQKAMIARWLHPGTRILILDEPSRGVDIGAREEIHAAIRRLAESGVGTIVISSDVEELAALADRVVVLREGRVTGELTGDDITESRVIELSYQDAN
jgi:ribose transport system ATP-binding protein